MVNINAATAVPISQYASKQHTIINLDSGSICVKSNAGGTSGTASLSILDWQIKEELTNKGLYSKELHTIDINEGSGGKTIRIAAKKPEATPKSSSGQADTVRLSPKASADAARRAPSELAGMFNFEDGPSGPSGGPASTSSSPSQIANEQVLPQVKNKAIETYKIYTKKEPFWGKMNAIVTIGKNGKVKGIKVVPNNGDGSYVPDNFCRKLEGNLSPILSSMQFNTEGESLTINVPINFKPGS
ncbi:MAG: hypothetical protein ABIH22_02045 [Candidatus Margulisiibacteriota bacterium]